MVKEGFEEERFGFRFFLSSEISIFERRQVLDG